MKPIVRSLVFLPIVAAISLVACGGGKVVVLPPSTTPQPTAAFAPAPAPAPSTVVVQTVPATPVPPAETITASPGAGYVWVAGYYDWRGDKYVWVPGSWVLTPNSASVWVSGHWQTSAGGYNWVPGHWE